MKILKFVFVLEMSTGQVGYSSPYSTCGINICSLPVPIFVRVSTYFFIIRR